MPELSFSITSKILIGWGSNPRNLNFPSTIFISRFFQLTSNDILLISTFFPFNSSTKLSKLKFFLLAPLALITIWSVDVFSAYNFFLMKIPCLISCSSFICPNSGPTCESSNLLITTTLSVSLIIQGLLGIFLNSFILILA